MADLILKKFEENKGRKRQSTRSWTQYSLQQLVFVENILLCCTY